MKSSLTRQTTDGINTACHRGDTLSIFKKRGFSNTNTCDIPIINVFGPTPYNRHTCYKAQNNYFEGLLGMFQILHVMWSGLTRQRSQTENRYARELELNPEAGYKILSPGACTGTSEKATIKCWYDMRMSGCDVPHGKSTQGVCTWGSDQVPNFRGVPGEHSNTGHLGCVLWAH